MAKPRIFVSSTYYDLKHIRSSLELFVESLGFEAILSEKGDIAYSPEAALDESCYREAAAADVFVLVIGGRYGSESSATVGTKDKSALDIYDSITRKEFETAYDADIPIFTVIESSVYAEYRTYLRNKDATNVKYAHVDSINVFRFIEFLSSKPRNNPIFSFERSAQIEAWLRDQWSGLFRELLRTRSQQRQLLALTGQVAELKAVNETLKTYLEAVLNRVTPETSKGVIENEEKRLDELRKIEIMRGSPWFSYMKTTTNATDQLIEDLIQQSKSEADLYTRISRLPCSASEKEEAIRVNKFSDSAQRDFNYIRKYINEQPIHFSAPGQEPDNGSILEVVGPPSPRKRQRAQSARKTST